MNARIFLCPQTSQHPPCSWRPSTEQAAAPKYSNLRLEGHGPGGRVRPPDCTTPHLQPCGAALTQGSPQPPPRPVLSFQVCTGFNKSCAQARPDASMPCGRRSSFIHSIHFLTSSSVDCRAPRPCQALEVGRQIRDVSSSWETDHRRAGRGKCGCHRSWVRRALWGKPLGSAPRTIHTHPLLPFPTPSPCLPAFLQTTPFPRYIFT